MGLAAGQARLLSITARLTDNEQSGQALSFAKQRLADETDQINKAYNEALSATKLTVLTGFNGAEAQYEDISYGLMTGYNTVAAGKQYVVTDAKGKILVSDKLAKAFKDGNGDFNYFLAHVDDVSSGQTVNYSQCDLDLSVRQSEANIKAVHEAWDKYWTSVGKDFYSDEHGPEDPEIQLKLGWDNNLNAPIREELLGYAYTTTVHSGGSYSVYIDKEPTLHLYTRDDGVNGGTVYYYKDDEGEEHAYRGVPQNSNNQNVGMFYGPVTYYYTGETEPINPSEISSFENINGSYFKKISQVNIPLNYDGTTEEQRDLYDYAVAITKEVYTSGTGLATVVQDPEVASKIQYYRNIFNQMAKFGYTTAAEMNIPVNGLNLELANNNRLLNDNNWFEQYLRQGKVQLKAYDSTKKDFISTTFDQDSSIQEVADERKIAKAEAQFTEAQDALERKDKKIDLELKKLDTEHNALQTEYESLKEVVKKNVEKSFNIFS